MKRCGLHVALLLGLSVTSALLGAEQEAVVGPLSLSTAPASGPTPVVSPVAFSKDSWSLDISASYLADLTNRDLQLAGASVGVNYYFGDGISLGVAGAGYHVSVSDADGLAGTLGVRLRQHLIRRERWSLYVDVSESLFEADHDVPRDGTHFNFLFQSGPGLTWQLTERVHVMAGVRYYHISNAQTQGADRNPASNGLEAYVGIMLPF